MRCCKRFVRTDGGRKVFAAKLLEILKGNPLDIVEVYCPMEICKKRNFLREDRYEAQSEEQLELMAKNIKYSMKVDTSVYTPAECAEIIVKELFV